MSGDQQFIVALVALTVNAVIALMTYRKASATHGMVNSELAEFKRLIAANALQSVIEAHARGVLEGKGSPPDAV